MELTQAVMAVCSLGMVAGGLMYMRCAQAGEERRRLLALKGGTTLAAALPALYAALMGLPASGWILAGILLCALADVVLELRFRAGMAAFALGHLCYIAGFSARGGLGAVNLICWVLGLCWLVYYVNRVARESGETRLPFLGYGAVISAMLASALTAGPLALAGALLFVVSDSLLLYGLMKGRPRGMGVAIMVTYWGAQYLIGVSSLMQAL